MKIKIHSKREKKLLESDGSTKQRKMRNEKKKDTKQD